MKTSECIVLAETLDTLRYTLCRMQDHDLRERLIRVVDSICELIGDGDPDVIKGLQAEIGDLEDEKHDLEKEVNNYKELAENRDRYAKDILRHLQDILGEFLRLVPFGYDHEDQRTRLRSDFNEVEDYLTGKIDLCRLRCVLLRNREADHAA